MSKAQHIETWMEAEGVDDLPEEWRHWCSLKRPELDPRKVWEMFYDHWISAGGQNARKRNWFATWRNWVRRTQAREAPRDQKVSLPHTPDALAAWARAHGFPEAPVGSSTESYRDKLIEMMKRRH